MKPSRSSLITLRRHRCHLRLWGEDDAPLLVMLHGWGDVSASWQFVVDAFSREWRVVAPDWRGFGLSEGNRDVYWFADYMADLDALLEQLSPNAPVDLVGHSMGGNIAGLYAGVRPGRVRRFVNIEGTGLPRHAPDEAPERYGQWLDQLRGPAPSYRPYADRHAFATRLMKDNPRLTVERAVWLAEHFTDELAEGGVTVNFDPWHRFTQPILYRVEEAMACWRRVEAPVLFVAGRQSFFFTKFYPLESDELRQRLACFRDLREVVFEDCGHNIHHDRPAELAALIEEFVTP